MKAVVLNGYDKRCRLLHGLCCKTGNQRDCLRVSEHPALYNKHLLSCAGPLQSYCKLHNCQGHDAQGN